MAYFVYLTWAFPGPLGLKGMHNDPYYNSVVYAPVTMKFGAGMELDVLTFYTVVTKSIAMLHLLRKHNVISSTHETRGPKILDTY